MRIVVTGVAGQLARSLGERAAARQGVELILIGRPELDLENPGTAAAAIAGSGADLVINCAAYTSVDAAEDAAEKAMRINGTGAGEVAAAAATIGAAIIQLSTDYVFDGVAGAPYNEKAGTNPLNVYGHTKLEGERAVQRANPQNAVVRTSWVYSPFDRNFVKTIVEAARTKPVLTVVGDQRGTPTCALQLADALLQLAIAWPERASELSGEIFHVAGPEEMSWCDFAVAIMSECWSVGLPSAKVRPVSTDEWPTKAKRPANSALCSAKFTNTLGFQMADVADSIAEVVRRLSV